MRDIPMISHLKKKNILRERDAVETQHTLCSQLKTFRTYLVDYNGNYIGIEIGITRNIRRYNVIFIIIHLIGGNAIIEP